MNKIQAHSLLTVFFDVGVVLSICIDMDECAIHSVCQLCHVSLMKTGILPLLQAHKMISSCALIHKGRYTKPTCLPIVGGPVLGGQRVAHHLTSRTGVDKLRFSAEAANDLHTGKRSSWCGGEGTRCGGGKPRKAAECRLCEHFEMRFAIEGGGKAEFGGGAMMWW